MHARTLQKPDGRKLTVYSRLPIEGDLDAPSPSSEPLQANPHLRWHPLRGEWVAYASHRQGRTFLPPPEYNPLGPTRDPAFPTEVPAGRYDIAVFDNRFPTLVTTAHDPPASLVETAPATGVCEVVVFTQDADASLGALPLSQIELLLEVWADRTREIGGLPHIDYVMPFENRGVEVGVTLHHPHGQIYAYPFVPPIPARMLAQQEAFWKEHGRGLLEDLIRKEIEEGARMLYQGDHAVAFVPAWARYPYEAWVAPTRPVATFCDLAPEQRADLARALKTTVLKYDGLWGRKLPYLQVWYQAPTDGEPHPEAHLHAELWPPYRTPDKLKYLAGTELGAGMFAMDVLPEDKARELAAVPVDLSAEEEAR
ncbi:galactose-1-phosphate uridylyltransferase [Sorangium sp. So ce1036]|uniref:galactose-1-phosphate uridylyltransferase n=1 Tax=Sorangium sp. So ce1036 TaxID=3133328 RepID=UPI003F07E0AD